MKTFSDTFPAVVVAATRALELRQPGASRLVDDSLAFEMLPIGWRALLRLLCLPGFHRLTLLLHMRLMPGTLGSLLCRTRYIDDVVTHLMDNDLEQLVILGAGLDARACRIGGLVRVHVFEVDLPGMIEMKRSSLQRVLGAIPEHVTLVPADLEQHNLGDGLRAAGFRPERPTLFVCEGVTQYLAAGAVDSVMKLVSAMSGSIVFSYVQRELIERVNRREGSRAIIWLASRLWPPVTFGLHPEEVETYLLKRGLSLLDHVGDADYRDRYLAVLSRDLSLSQGERIAFARATRA